MKPIEIVLKFEKSTPGTHVFKTEDPNASVTQLYIKRTGFSDGKIPTHVRITVTESQE